MDYDFSTLNDKEFELLALDLLNIKFKLKLQAFKGGRDEGIDLRFSTNKKDNELVVQAKHYAGSEFAQLKHTLKGKELKKIFALNPNRYIVVTSLPLKATEKDEIREILKPYILNSNDVIGKEDLNTYLREFPAVEKNHFKLWFSSINILNSILNNAIEGRTRFHLNSVKSKIKFYVVTKKLDEANKLLQKEKLLLITGQPGIGKTTLADIILIDRAKKGFKIYKVENIREAEDVISPDNDEKQVFYFDDFLGANYYEILNANKTETQLTSFVERVKNTPNKYLILTTRTIILNHAIGKYEKFGTSRITNQQFEIRLTDYTRYEKALILYNHLYFNSLKKELLNAVLHKQFYFNIINHKNYTPRIIEFITDKTKIEKLSSSQYLQFILNNLNNPKEIWRYSFKNQIDNLEQILLLTLFSFESNVSEKRLNNAFEKRLEYEKNEHNQIFSSDQFNESIKVLLNGFIVSKLIEIISDKLEVIGTYRQYSFINPSLVDFLIGHLSESFSEKKSIISSVIYFDQLDRFNQNGKILLLEKELQLIIRDRIASNQILFNENKQYSDGHKSAIILETLCRYCNEVNIDNLLLDKLKKVELTSRNLKEYYDSIVYMLLNLGDAPLTYDYIKANFIEIIERLMLEINDEENAKNISILFEKYDRNLDEYHETNSGLNNLLNLIEKVLKKDEDRIIRDHKHRITDFDAITEYYEEISTTESQLISSLFPNSIIHYDFGIKIDDKYWNEIIEKNIRQEEEKNEDYDDYYRDIAFEEENDVSAIEDLFSKWE